MVISQCAANQESLIMNLNDDLFLGFCLDFLFHSLDNGGQYLQNPISH